MTTRDEDSFNAETQAFLVFDAEGTGEFQFGYVRGGMGCRPTAPQPPKEVDGVLSQSSRQIVMADEEEVPGVPREIWDRLRASCSIAEAKRWLLALNCDVRGRPKEARSRGTACPSNPT